MADEATRRVVSEIPVLKTNAGPRDRELWVQRLKEEYQALIRVSRAPAAARVAQALWYSCVLRNGLRVEAISGPKAEPPNS